MRVSPHRAMPRCVKTSWESKVVLAVIAVARSEESRMVFASTAKHKAKTVLLGTQGSLQISVVYSINLWLLWGAQQRCAQ